jgi:fatty acid desaturase
MNIVAGIGIAPHTRVPALYYLNETTIVASVTVFLFVVASAAMILYLVSIVVLFVLVVVVVIVVIVVVVVVVVGKVNPQTQFLPSHKEEHDMAAASSASHFSS